jgi:general nucleoside transport system ATP-binding protein
MAKTKTATENPLISMQGITKAFPGVLANDAINLDIFRSEVHALLGENGAGKSTLMKILYGFYRADSGKIFMEGKQVQIQTPADARTLQIGMVFQEFNLIPAFTVAENIALFFPDLKAVLQPREIESRVKEVSDRYELHVDPHSLVSQLCIGEQQKVEIIKLLLSNSKVLILDEPTRVLAPHEVKALFEILSKLRQDGYAIILITHKLNEVMECADRITVLRRGKVAGTLLRKDASEGKLIELMFEKSLARLKTKQRAEVQKPAQVFLHLDHASTKGEGSSVALKDICLDVFSGEIVGIAGVSGNGQRELGDLVLGMERCNSGKKVLFGQDATQWSIGKIRDQGLAFIPENPLQMAVTPWMPVIQNMALTRTHHYAKWGGLGVDWRKLIHETRDYFNRFGFSVPSLYFPARSLSGGNLQRMIIARELGPQPRFIVASYLTNGLDVQSTLAARQALIDARVKGSGILLISEDLDELFTLSDRIVVMYEGRIVGSFQPQETNVYEVGLLMTGSKVEHDAN